MRRRIPFRSHCRRDMAPSSGISRAIPPNARSRRPDPGHGYVGQTIEVPTLTAGPAYIAVWDPRNSTGEYTILFNIEPDPENPELDAKYSNPIAGDANEDGKIDTADVILTLKTAVGLIPATPRRLRTLDVWPRKTGTTLQGDGKVNLADVIRLLNRVVGLEPDPFP